MNKNLVIASLLIATGCATVFKGKTTDIDVTSTTPGAAVTVDGRAVGVTPTRVTLPSQTDATIMVAANGRQDICHLETHASTTWVVADLFLTSGLGLLIDWATHNWNEVGPTYCHAAV